MSVKLDSSSQLLSIGKEAIPLLIMDNAVPKAEAFKQHAIQSCENLFEQGLYPGFRCQTMPQYSHFLIELVNKEIKHHVQQLGASFNAMTSANAYFSMVTKSPKELKEAQRIAHYDRPESGQLAVVHYLCDQSHGGTSFYRHKNTGFEVISPLREPEYIKQLALDCQAYPPEYQYMNGDTELFQRIHSVDAKFNRLIAYPSNCLHSGNIARDFVPTMNPNEGRFTVTAFLE